MQHSFGIKAFYSFFFISWLKEKKISLKEEAKKLKALLMFKYPICKIVQVEELAVKAENKFGAIVHPERLFSIFAAIVMTHS